MGKERFYQVCLITGASSGIGRALAVEMVRRGWFVVAVARRAGELEGLAEEVGRDRLLPIPCDTASAEQIAEASASLRAKGLLPTLIVLNAGTGGFEEPGALDTELHERTFSVNYFGALHWIREWLPALTERGEGAFVAVSSLAAWRAMPATAAYGASKAAMSHAFESLRYVHRGTGVRFVRAHPGPVDTAMLKVEPRPPFTWKSEKAAAYLARKVLSGRQEINFPPFWAAVFRVFRILPGVVYGRLFRQRSG